MSCRSCWYTSALLTRSLLRAAAGVAALLLPGFLAAPAATRALVRWAVPERLGALHYFAPLEAFRAQLHVGFVLALAAAWPWVALQAWAFVRPGLREEEAVSFVCSVVFLHNPATAARWTGLALALAARLGFASAAGLRRARPYAVVAILTLSALLTPPDVVSQVLLAVPTLLLYELGIRLAEPFEKRD